MISRIVCMASLAIPLIIALHPPATIVEIVALAFGLIVSTFTAPLVLGLYLKRDKYGALIAVI